MSRRRIPQARLYKKSTAGEAKPRYLGHVIIENRHGLVVAACATQSSTTAEREAALAMLDEMARATTAPGQKRITLGADKLYQEQKFIEGLRQRGIAPHVAEYEKASTYWPNFLNQAERNDPGFAISQKRETQTGGDGIWLGQAGQHHAQVQAARGRADRLVVPSVGNGQQSGAHGEAEKVNSSAVSAGSSVSAGRNEVPAETKMRCSMAAQLENNDYGEKLP